MNTFTRIFSGALLCSAFAFTNVSALDMKLNTRLSLEGGVVKGGADKMVEKFKSSEKTMKDEGKSLGFMGVKKFGGSFGVSGLAKIVDGVYGGLGLGYSLGMYTAPTKDSTGYMSHDISLCTPVSFDVMDFCFTVGAKAVMNLAAGRSKLNGAKADTNVNKFRFGGFFEAGYKVMNMLEFGLNVNTLFGSLVKMKDDKGKFMGVEYAKADKKPNLTIDAGLYGKVDLMSAFNRG